MNNININPSFSFLLECPEKISDEFTARVLGRSMPTDVNEGHRFKLPTYSNCCISKDNYLIDENKAPSLKNKTKKVFHWKKEEHRLSLEGVEKYGKGNWKDISKHVGTKTPTQVASHAQKHFIRVDKQGANSSKKSERRIINSTSWNEDFHPLHYRDYTPLPPTSSWNGDFHPLLYRDYIPSPPPPNVEKESIVEQILQLLQ